jgi:hypothetical protein
VILPQPDHPAKPQPTALVPSSEAVHVRYLPPAEAGALVQMKYAVHGDQPLRGLNLEV